MVELFGKIAKVLIAVTITKREAIRLPHPGTDSNG
jgi:hypothetical protein